MSKVSMRALDKVLSSYGKLTETSVVEFGNEDSKVEIEVRYMLSLQEAQEFVDVVVGGSFDEDESGALVYSGIMRQYAFHLAFLTYFTNIKPELGPERVYTMMYKAGLMDMLMEKVCLDQIVDLHNAIDHGVQYMMDLTSSTQSVRSGELMNSIESLIVAMNAATANFGSIPNEQIKAAVDKLSGVSEEKIISVLTKEGDTNVETSGATAG